MQYLNSYFVKYKWHLLLGIVFVALSNYFRVLQPQAIRQALDLVYENVRSYRLYDGFEAQQALLSSIGSSLLSFGLLVMLLAVIMGIFMYYMRQTIIVMSRLIEYDLRKELYDHYQKMDLAFFKKTMTGDLMARISEDVSKVRMYLGPAVLYGINLSTLFVMVIYSMFSVSPELSWYCLLPLPILSLSIYFVSSIIHKKSEVIQRQLARLNSISQEVFSGIRVVKSYTHEPHMLQYFSAECDVYKDKSMNLATVNALFFPLMLLIIGASTILTIYFGGVQVYKGNITPGNIAEFVIYVNMLTWPVTAIGWIASIVQQAEASQGRINEFLSVSPVIVNTVEEESKLSGLIEFDQVTFNYPDTGIRALHEVSFTLRPGEKLAIVGRTGSGKTTIAELLVRMYDVQDGTIKLDGLDIRKHNLAALRRQVGYVPQDVFLFSTTIEKNIGFGKDEMSDGEAAHYAERAAIKDDILALPEGFDTMVGERGVTLSGGQKQRISIARAFIKKPSIVVMDDCLSAVDTDTENKIVGFLEEDLGDTTTIIITHRIYGSLVFDKIIVLDEGKIIEEGNHEDLLQLGGYYAEMYERQRVSEVLDDV